MPKARGNGRAAGAQGGRTAGSAVPGQPGHAAVPGRSNATGESAPGSAPTPGHPARSPIPGRDRLPSLTGLRFWAALLVVLYHLSHQVGDVQPISALTMFGRTGVTFFFVLSGFVLAWTYLDRPTPVGTFLWRRLARIWPLVAVTGIASLVAFWIIGQHVEAWPATTTFLLLQSWHPSWVAGANSAAWSLSDEAFFYLAFPLLLLLAARRRSRTWLWAGCGVVVVGLWLWFALSGWPAWALDYFPPSRVVQFVIGVCCGVAMRRGARAPVGYGWSVTLVIAFHIALIGWAQVVDPLSTFGARSGSQWWSVLVFALLICAAAQSDLDGARTGAQGPWSLRLGHWSYAWYLIHEVIIRLWVHATPRSDSTWVYAAEWALLIPVTLVAAGLLYQFVEHPAERWLRPRVPRLPGVRRGDGHTARGASGT